MITLIYLFWVAACLMIFAIAPRRYAVWICLLAGWIWLPPAIYPDTQNVGFPFWILGGSLPSDILVSKAWVAPVATALASLAFDARRWRDLSLNLWDFALIALCLWPLLQDAIIGDALPAGWVSSLYLTGCWAVPWLLGRIYLRNINDMQAFAAVLTVLMLALLPIAVFEGLNETRVHTSLFGEHPYAGNGVERYIGYRPQAFFENGNQYGLWVAIAAVVAVWNARQDKRFVIAAAVLVLMTVASQSAGAVALMGLGVMALVWGKSFSFAYRYGVWTLVAGAILGALLIAGLLPIRSLIENTAVGQALLDGIRATGRGSFAWRVSQDLKAVSLLREHLLIGHGVWDWFMVLKSRPWGLPLLVIGQFGLIGLFAMLLPMLRGLWRSIGSASRGDEAAKLAAIILIVSAIDAALNSFLFWPFVLIAAAYCCSDLQESEVKHQPCADPA